MRNFEFFLDKLSELGRVEITCYSHGQYWDLRTHTGFNPLRENADLRERLIDMTTKRPQLPALIRDAHDVLFSAILWDDDSVYDSEAGFHRVLTEEEQKDTGSPAWFLIGPAAHII